MSANNRMTQINDTALFHEKINLTKLKYIVNNPSKYEDLIQEQERDMRRYTNYNAFAVFQKIISNSFVPPEFEGTDFAYIKVSYLKGDKSNGIGRWYCKKSIGLQSLTVSVRHTICEGIWSDIDQVNSHPTIFKTFMNKYGFESPLLNECLTNREVFLKRVGGSREQAKTKVIAIINGASYPNHKVLHQLSLELKPCIDYVINLPEYANILEYVKKTYDTNIEGKSISRILQVIENNLLECYIEWAHNKGFIDEKNQVALIFDGFQLLSKFDITDDLLLECANFAKDKTDYYIPLKVKPFDNPLIIPDNYKECFDTIPALIDKYSVGLDLFVENHTKDYESLSNNYTDLGIATLGSKLFKNVIYYDDICDKWFYCNTSNIWCECKRGIVLKSLLQTVFNKSFNLYAKKCFQNAYKEGIEQGVADLWQIRAKTSLRIANLVLGNACNISNILKYKELYVKSKFYEDLIDSNSHLFAFSNKVFDFNTNTYRPIKPLDYIMTNTGYDFPEYVENCDVKFLEEYFETLFPDTEKRNYVLDSSCITLNADRKEQFFNIHTGNGSNSKTTFNNLFESSLGGYACEISPETFTKPKKSANDTGELYKTKGKRAIFSNEPESDQDKLQTALLKRIADESGRKIIARALYCDPIEFKITFILNFFCNNKPELSSVDGGIARRLRIIDWKVKFVDAPDPDNVYQKPKNPDIMSKMRSDGVKNAFIRMLIDRWTNRVSQFKLIPVPQVVIDASNEYVDDSNPVLGFINENYELTNNTDDKVSSAVLYNHFTSYTHGTKIGSKRFKDDLLGISGIETKRGNKGVVFTGLKKKEDEDDE